jgi:hypothetical protein
MRFHSTRIKEGAGGGARGGAGVNARMHPRAEIENAFSGSSAR